MQKPAISRDGPFPSSKKVTAVKTRDYPAWLASGHSLTVVRLLVGSRQLAPFWPVVTRTSSSPLIDLTCTHYTPPVRCISSLQMQLAPTGLSIWIHSVDNLYANQPLVSAISSHLNEISLVTARLRHSTALPKPSLRTKKHCSSINYGLHHYQ